MFLMDSIIVVSNI